MRVGDSVGYKYPTMHFGNDTRWRTREDKQRFNFVYVNQRNDQRIPLLVENHSEKNLYQLNFDRQSLICQWETVFRFYYFSRTVTTCYRKRSLP